MPPATPTGEVALTRYIIFETDEAAVTLKRIGEQLGRSRDDALRKFTQREPYTEQAPTYMTAISENHCKLSQVGAKVTTSISAPETLGELDTGQTTILEGVVDEEPDDTSAASQSTLEPQPVEAG